MSRSRRPVALAGLLAAGVVWSSAAQAVDAPEWNHDPDDPDRGPLSWAQIDESFEACEGGQSQSPVDVGDATETRLPTLRAHYPRFPLTVENTGHVIEVPIPEGSAGTLTVGRDRYRLLQFHLHAPSEHTVDGRSFDMEAHLVHRDPASGALAVVGVFLDAAEAQGSLVDLVVANAPDQAEEEHEVDARISPAALLPRGSGAGPGNADSGPVASNVTDYRTYAGSLTTPPCSEGVTWFVVTRPGTVSPSSVQRHHDLVAELPGYDHYDANNRPVQPLNDRTVLRSR